MLYVNGNESSAFGFNDSNLISENHVLSIHSGSKYYNKSVIVCNVTANPIRELTLNEKMNWLKHLNASQSGVCDFKDRLLSISLLIFYLENHEHCIIKTDISQHSCSS